MAENHEAIHHTKTSSSPLFDDGDVTSVKFSLLTSNKNKFVSSYYWIYGQRLHYKN